MRASLHSCGTSPVCIDLLKICANTSPISSLTSCKNLGCSSSIPGLLSVLNNLPTISTLCKHSFGIFVRSKSLFVCARLMMWVHVHSLKGTLCQLFVIIQQMCVTLTDWTE